MAGALGNVGKYEFLMGGNVLPEKWQLEKAATIKILKYSSLTLFR